VILKVDVTKPKRIWYRHKEKIIDLLMVLAASFIVITMIITLVLAK
jgi:hypothetical protein